MDNLCRTCMASNAAKEPFFSIFETVKYDDSARDTVAALLERFCSVKIEENDALPKHICNDCYDQLLASMKFRHRCEQTDIRLRDLLEDLEVGPQVSIIFKDSKIKVEPTELLPPEEQTSQPCEIIEAHEGQPIQPCEILSHEGQIAESCEIIPHDEQSTEIFYPEQSIGDVEELSRYYNLIEITNFVCCLCGAILHSQADRDNHVAVAHDMSIPQQQAINDLICYICQQQFSVFEQLDAHTKIVQVRYQCALCGTIFDSEEQVMLHFQQAHSIKIEECISSSLQEAPITPQHRCSIPDCPEAFTEKEQLITHLLRCHTAKPVTQRKPAQKRKPVRKRKPQPCEIVQSVEVATIAHKCCIANCQETFANQNELITHILKSHKANGSIVSYNCSFCKTTYSSAEARNHHELDHIEKRRLL